MNLKSLYEGLLALLERFLLLFVAWNNGRLTEKLKTVLKASQRDLEIKKLKERIQSEAKALRDQDLSSRTIID